MAERAGTFYSGGHGDAVEVDVCRNMQALVRRADTLMRDRSHVVHARCGTGLRRMKGATEACRCSGGGGARSSLGGALGQINKRADDLYAIDLELMEWILAL